MCEIKGIDNSSHGSDFYTFFQRFKCYKLIVKELHCSNIQFFTAISKRFQLQLTVTKMSDHVIKYYGIIETMKVLIIIKKILLSRTNILIQNRSFTLRGQASSDFSNTFMILICQDGKLAKGWNIIPN